MEKPNGNGRKTPGLHRHGQGKTRRTFFGNDEVLKIWTKPAVLPRTEFKNQENPLPTDRSRHWPHLNGMILLGFVLPEAMWCHIFLTIKYRRKQNPSGPSYGLFRKCVWPVMILYPSSTFALKQVETLQAWSPFKLLLDCHGFQFLFLTFHFRIF